ncbi:MAG: hypothetical protein IPJ88_07750 [Myxococcales bacterium]|nr:MAG: hypothetical protein IPJ88_07750 [Myxococcales bacterium]
MTEDLITLGLFTGVGAAWLATHFALVFMTVLGTKINLIWRLLALVPPLTPIAAWVKGSRVFPVLWFLLGLSYLVLRYAL